MTRLTKEPPAAPAGDRPGPRPAAPPVPGDSMDSWLSTLARMLRWNQRRFAPLREELSEHLRQRAHDLMLEGMDEHAAARVAVSELGDAAAVAERFRAAEAPRIRRTVMNLTMLALAGSAAVFGGLALNVASTPQPVSGRIAPPMVAYAPPDEPEKLITLADDASVSDFCIAVGTALGDHAHMHAAQLEEVGITGDLVLNTPIRGVTVERAFVLANDALGRQGVTFGRLACRRTGEVLEFSTIEHFDRREVTLVTYDIGDLLPNARGEGARELRDETLGEISGLITGFVEMESWHDNGGDLAHLRVVGDKLFVEAPARFHPQIEWLLAQLRDGAAAPEGAAQAPTLTARRFALGHRPADEIAQIVDIVLRGSAAGKVMHDPRTNTVVVMGDAALHDKVRDLLDLLDK